MEFILIYVLFQFAYGLVAADMPPCDAGWIPARGNCYLINNQRLVTWSQARGECNSHQASSLYFESMDELTWYKNMVKTQYPSSGYWTSMNDVIGRHLSEPGTRVWKWNMYEYINTSIVQWSSSLANDGRPACGGLNLQGKMYDADCNSRQGFICQIDGGVANGGCLDWWVAGLVDCYFVSNTSLPGSLMTWSQAKKWCGNLNMYSHLIVIDDVDDQTFLNENLPYLAQTPYLFWTGLNGSGQAAAWRWGNGVTFKQKLVSWAVEPDNIASQENCGVIRYNGKFSDRGCNMKQNYICVKPMRNAGPVPYNLGCGLMTRAGTKCYGFYKSDHKTWQGAKQACGSISGDLVNVQDLDTKEWINEQMFDPDKDHYYWTALNDRQIEGTYMWSDERVYDQNIVAWDHEPNNYGGDEDCGMVWAATGTYNDMPCTYKSATLCEINNVRSCPVSWPNHWHSRPADNGTGSDCYLFGEYANSSLWMTADEAGDYCTSLTTHDTDVHGQPVYVVPHMLIVNSAAERDWINQQLTKRKDNSVGFWTALNDRTSEGFWQFGNDPTIDTSFVSWGGEPHSGKGYNCGAVCYRSPEHGCKMSWGGEPNSGKDYNCGALGYGANFYIRDCNKKFAFICERSAFLSWDSSSGASITAYSVTLTLVLQSVIQCWIRYSNIHSPS